MSLFGTGFGNTFFALLILFLLFLLFRFLYVRHLYRLQARAYNSEARSAANNPHLAPYFIRIRAMADARIEQINRQERQLSTDLPPKYDDIVDTGGRGEVPKYDDIAGEEGSGQGHTNLGATGDSGLPEYDQCIQVDFPPESASPRRP